jgi:hypothetical protein
MSKELSEIRYYIGDSLSLEDENMNDEDIPMDEYIVESTNEQETHIRIVDCLLELKQFIKNNSFEILEQFNYGELYDFLSS